MSTVRTNVRHQFSGAAAGPSSPQGEPSGEFDAHQGEAPIDLASIPHLVAHCRSAQLAWHGRGLRSRLSTLRAFRRLVVEQRAAISAQISEEVGKPVVEALATEVAVVLDDVARTLRRAPALLRPRRQWARNPALWRKPVTIYRDPVGAVAVIAPWNYPFMLPAGHVVAALIAGNSVILKPSELAPRTGQLLVRLLQDAGVPPNAVRLLPGDAAIGAALIDAGVDFVSFTGGVRGGRAVARACAERGIPCALELGGSDAAIVLEDADIARTARGLVWGRFVNAGQSCVAPKRILVVSSRHAALLDALRSELSRLRVRASAGDEADVGPVISVAAAAAVREQVEATVAAGGSRVASAPILASYSQFSHDRPDDTAAKACGGRLVAPVLLTAVPSGSPAWEEEVFGPVMAVRSVVDEAEALALANASPFALSASVWTSDAGRAKRLASVLRAGSVAINDVVSVVGHVEVPHGGLGQSGTGRLHGDEGLLEYTRTRSVIEELLPTLANPWWYPYSARQHEDFSTFVGLLHGDRRSPWRAIPAVWRLIRSLFAP
jgi:acyl-CoA reductase-like NAD-dependent aldehyde dehydrogenase